MLSPALDKNYPSFSSNEKTYFSRHGGTWIDRSDFEPTLQEKLDSNRITEGEAFELTQFHKNGFVIIKQVAPKETIDKINKFIEKLWRGGRPEIKLDIVNSIHSIRADLRDQPFKILDLYYYNESIRKALLAPRIVRFLTLLFETSPLLFQSLNFERGTEQAIHQDTAYVVVNSPMKMAAAWIALQDVAPGTGELEYYSGSHRLPDFDFGNGKKHWSGTDGHGIHDRFLKSLATESKNRGFPRQRFLPESGDALIWHADLAHGGSKIKQAHEKRLSMVGHYCPVSQSPAFYSRVNDPLKHPHDSGGFFGTPFCA